MAKKRAVKQKARSSKKAGHVHSEECDHDHARGSAPPVGTIGWLDLTVKDSRRLRDFYAAVVGWKPTEVDMGGYADYCMNRPADGQTVAGVCHARGANADLPPQWLIYINVASLKTSLARCRKLGGKVICPARKLMGGRMAVIRDPAGAVAALYEPACD